MLKSLKVDAPRGRRGRARFWEGLPARPGPPMAGAPVIVAARARCRHPV